MIDPIEVFYERQRGIREYLSSQLQLSFAQDVEDTTRKNLALAAASYFEHELTAILSDFADRRSNGCSELVAFIQNKALKRQFHTLFDWEKGKNANAFFALFGESFKSSAESATRQDPALQEAIKSFLELGYLRNCIVHQNYASFATDKTADEILTSYRKAKEFLGYLRGRFI
jgi:RiboL-PSP-HEPN